MFQLSISDIVLPASHFLSPVIARGRPEPILFSATFPAMRLAYRKAGNLTISEHLTWEIGLSVKRDEIVTIADAPPRNDAPSPYVIARGRNGTCLVFSNLSCPAACLPEGRQSPFGVTSISAPRPQFLCPAFNTFGFGTSVTAVKKMG